MKNIRINVLNPNYINHSLFAKALAGIPFSGTLEEFQFRCDINSTITARALLNHLQRRGVGRFSGTQIRFTPSDKLNVLIICLEEGCQPSQLSSKLDWKDFELLTTLILQRQCYNAMSNIQFTKPRVQIDIVAISGRVVLVIDCKHWKKMSKIKMVECAIEQRRRAKIYFDKMRSCSSIIIPLIVTLHELPQQIIYEVPFVPITKLYSFIKEFELNLDRFVIFPDTYAHVSSESRASSDVASTQNHTKR